MLLQKKPNAEPIPGYQLVEKIGQGGFGEVWKCVVPGGMFKAIKFVCSSNDLLKGESDNAQKELRAIERVKSIRHPFLLSIERVEIVSGELVIVTELADKSLTDICSEYQKAGFPGIPRSQLLGYLRETAEMLDVLNMRYDLQHLDIKPGNLLLIGNHVKLADFGLVQTMSPAAGEIKGDRLVGGISPLYASPEMFCKQISRQCDQYSLAIVYQEMLTGTLPFAGKNARQMMMLHLTAEPDVSPLSDADRNIVRKALAKNPQERFPTCAAFIHALHNQNNQKSVTVSVEQKNQTQEAKVNLTETRNQIGTAFEISLPPDPAKNGSSLTTKPRSTPEISIPQRQGKNQNSEASGHFPLPQDLQFLKNISSDPLLDKWIAKDAQGREFLVRHIFGIAGLSDPQKQALGRRLQQLNHELLLDHSLGCVGKDRLTIVSPNYPYSLHDRLQQCLALQRPGIPRDELLSYLKMTAEGLDYLHRQYSLQHLALTPQRLLLDRDRILVDEFGLCQLIWLPAGQPFARRLGRFAAPELLTTQPGLSSDQYSLAMIYQYLLTGQRTVSWKQLQMGGSLDEVLAHLPESDRAIVAKALSEQPADRWSSSSEFIQQLIQVNSESAEIATPSQPPTLLEQDEFCEFISRAGQQTRPKQFDASPSALADLNQILIQHGVNARELQRDDKPLRPTISKNRRRISLSFDAGLSAATARSKVDVLRQIWYGTVSLDEESHYQFAVQLPSKFWREKSEKVPTLEVSVCLQRKEPLVPLPIEVSIDVRARNCRRRHAYRMLRRVGLAMVERLRNGLLVNSEQRVQTRIDWHSPIMVQPIFGNGSAGEVVACRGRDLSSTGIGFYLPHPMPTADVLITIPGTSESPVVCLPATMVRALRCPDGWYEIGALFSQGQFQQSL